MTYRPAAFVLSRQRGFSLVEVMIGLAIGLLCTLVVASVLATSEGNRRGTTSGSDAQVNGKLALFRLQSEMAEAGYGFASEENAVGCPLIARWGGTAAAGMPAVLAPLAITAGPANGSDTLRVLASSKQIDPDAAVPSSIGFAIPLRVRPPYYAPGQLSFSVSSVISYAAGDLVAFVVGAGLDCELFEVTGAPTAAPAPVLPRADDAGRWNDVGFPTQAAQAPCDVAADCPAQPLNPTGSLLVNLGRLIDREFSVNAEQQLIVSTLDTATRTRTEQAVQSGIVLLKAYYGHDTDGDGAVDQYDKVTPTTQQGWQRVLAVKLAVVARSAHFEKEAVTAAALQWPVGTAVPVTGATTCDAGACVDLDLSALPDWQHYRYRVFDTVVALHNQRLKSRAPTP